MNDSVWVAHVCVRLPRQAQRADDVPHRRSAASDNVLRIDGQPAGRPPAPRRAVAARMLRRGIAGAPVRWEGGHRCVTCKQAVSMSCQSVHDSAYRHGT
jgi:hypothetical protein